MWTGGPAKPSNYPEDWGGRPLWVTDMSDPYHPVTSPLPIDLERHDGTTDYIHDVQVDDVGIAWVSGAGGVRGYHTSGVHFDPVLRITREATAFDPVPAGGGGIAAFNSSFSHNSFRPVGADKDQGADLSLGYEEGELLYVTEEAFTGGCVNDGIFAIVRVTGSEDGQGWRSTSDDPYRLETVGTWSPVGNPGTSAGLCSAHYFDMKDGLVVYSWYQYGTRFIDVSDPANPIQVGYFSPPGNNSFSPFFNGDHVYIGDSARGIDIVTLNASMAQNRTTRTVVEAVISPQKQADLDAAVFANFAPDPAYGWACRIDLSAR